MTLPKARPSATLDRLDWSSSFDSRADDERMKAVSISTMTGAGASEGASPDGAEVGGGYSVSFNEKTVRLAVESPDIELIAF